MNANRPGLTLMEGGTRFCLFSHHAQQVTLCLFDDEGGERQVAADRHGDYWETFVEGVGVGQAYGYRVDGPWAPEAGHRFNPAKLLLDPYARKLSGPIVLHPSHFDSRRVGSRRELNTEDSGQYMPKCIVTAPPAGTLSRSVRRTPMSDAVIYELHVKGFTKRHPSVPSADAGRYTGLAHPDVVAYLRSLGITAVELLPIQEFVDEAHLAGRGLTNYWGYNPLLYFVPTSRYATRDARSEFQEMVAALHDAGIEVILDVVYNHTAESGTDGPTWCYRGIDNVSYYRLEDLPECRYVNHSGCGNSLNASHPAVRQLIIDSLRFWVTDMHVDGFRFDLATGLGRTGHGFDCQAPMFQAIAADPVLKDVRLIAEPWDVGTGGYQLGGFPSGWSEWNDKFRDSSRRFWRGDEGALRDFASHFHGSSHTFEPRGRTPDASLNYITAHDGFTLRDLVTYGRRHNHANRESNRDGNSHAVSFNCGIEGETSVPKIQLLRCRQQKNMLMTLLLSQGVPMLLAGDERSRTQQGNNNAYCQDNEISWIDWTETAGAESVLRFVRELVNIRKSLPELRLGRYIHSEAEIDSHMQAPITWFHPTGEVMSEDLWHEPGIKSFGMMLNGPAISWSSPNIARLVLVWFNANPFRVDVRLPASGTSGCWRCVISSVDEDPDPVAGQVSAGSTISLPATSSHLFVYEEES